MLEAIDVDAMDGKAQLAVRFCPLLRGDAVYENKPTWLMKPQGNSAYQRSKRVGVELLETTIDSSCASAATDTYYNEVLNGMTRTESRSGLVGTLFLYWTT